MNSYKETVPLSRAAVRERAMCQGVVPRYQLCLYEGRASLSQRLQVSRCVFLIISWDTYFTVSLSFLQSRPSVYNDPITIIYYTSRDLLSLIGRKKVEFLKQKRDSTCCSFSPDSRNALVWPVAMLQNIKKTYLQL